MKDDDQLQQQVERDTQQRKKAERERHSVLSETVFVGSLGLMFVLPVIAGAYLGHWLDSQLDGYSMRWTLSLLIAGLALGGYSVYRSLRE